MARHSQVLTNFEHESNEFNNQLTIETQQGLCSNPFEDRRRKVSKGWVWPLIVKRNSPCKLSHTIGGQRLAHKVCLHGAPAKGKFFFGRKRVIFEEAAYTTRKSASTATSWHAVTLILLLLLIVSYSNDTSKKLQRTVTVHCAQWLCKKSCFESN
jgi:hypothetical protein